MRKLFFAALTILLLLSLVFTAGCSQPAPSPSPGTAGSPAPAPAPEKTYKLVFTTWDQPDSHLGKIHQQAAQMVEEKTNGRVKIDLFFSGSLVDYFDTFAGVASGRADIGTLVSQTSETELNQIFDQISIGIPEQDRTSLVFFDLFNKYPQLQEEMAQKGVRWLGVRAMAPYQLHLTNKPVRVPADLKGMRIIAGGDMVNNAGGASLQVAPPDMYLSLERGLADGQIIHWNAIDLFKIKELFKYHVEFGGEGRAVRSGGWGYIINLDTWNSLPADIQAAVQEAYDWAIEDSIKHNPGIKCKEEARAEGHTFIMLTPEEVALWEELAVPVAEDWIVKTEAKGWPAREMYETFQQLVEKYR